MTKRRFLAAVAVAFLSGACVAEAEALEADSGELTARARGTAGGAAERGVRQLRGHDALLYVPGRYRPDRPAPLLVMLHGAGGNAGHSIDLARAHAERQGFLVLAPKSKRVSWDIISARRFGPDVAALDSALKEVFAAYSIDPAQIAVGGFSDGASYALSLGLINGGLFSDVFAFAPGFIAPGRVQGRPRVFISHGIADRVLPIDATSRRIVPELKRAGYAVDYAEFAGGHEVPKRIARRFLERLAAALPRHPGEGRDP